MTKHTSPAPRRVEARRWTLLGTAAAAGIAVAAHGTSEGANVKAPGAQFLLAAASQASQGGEGGEGAAARPGEEDAHFIASLGYVEGHLRAGLALYEAGATEMAKTHMKHPEDEIYAKLKPQLASRKADDFGPELAELSEAVAGGAPAARAKEIFGEIEHEIHEAREYVGGGAATRLNAIVMMVRTAAEEYALGVKDGKIVKTHEYQDAWGFVQAAQAIADELKDDSRPEVQEALAKVREQFAVIAPAFGPLVPDADASGADPAILYGAAARMEIAALAVK